MSDFFAKPGLLQKDPTCSQDIDKLNQKSQTVHY